MVKTGPFILLFITCIFVQIIQHTLGYNSIGNEIDGNNIVYKLVEGSTRFSLELLRTLMTTKDPGNEAKDLFFSPFSVWSALVVTYMGARGTTRQEMRKVLGVGDARKAITWEAFRSIRCCNPHRELNAANFNSANRIYFQKGTTLKKYIKKMLYDDVAFVDFQNHTDEARITINSWVEKYTHKMIKELFPPSSIDKMTKMVIANAVYFKEAWLQPFEPQDTSRRKFTVSPGQRISVKMMSTKGMFLHGKSEQLKCSILEMPYSDNSFSMIILLPNDRFGGVDSLVGNLTSDILKTLHDGMLPREVKVSIPKFKIEGTFELATALKEMGLNTLFDSTRVNLSGFTGQREFRLDSVRHKTFIDVNEEGTEAAAASAAIFYSRNARPSVRTFTADHPFVYLIQDNISHAILFIGIIHKPPKYGTL